VQQSYKAVYVLKFYGETLHAYVHKYEQKQTISLISSLAYMALYVILCQTF